MAEKQDGVPTYPPQGHLQGAPVPPDGAPVQQPVPHPHAVAPTPQVIGNKWSSSFWDCCSPIDACLCGWCCPCFLFGKTQSRLNDPTFQSSSYCNGDCCLWSVLGCCSLHWVLQTIKRGDMRERFGIEGSCFGDCMGAFCCPCCGLVQQEKEAKLHAGSTQNAPGYRPTQSMAYPQ